MNISILFAPGDSRTDLRRELERLGARVIEWPQLRIDEPQDDSAIDEAIENLFGYDWLIFKSEAAAEYFLRRFEREHRTDELDELKILAIGEKTDQRLVRSQVHIDVKADHSSEAFALLSSYAGEIKGLNCLLPSATITRASFAGQLEEVGARVDSVATYRTCESGEELAKVKALLAGGGVDYIAFGQPANVADFGALFDTDDLQPVVMGSRVVCADEPTRSAAGGFGLDHLLIPDEPTIQAFARLITTRTC